MSPWQRNHPRSGALLVSGIFAILLLSSLIASAGYCGWRLCSLLFPGQ
jgi:hypothetical protein